MAKNPPATGTFEYWLSARLPFPVLTPKPASAPGGMESWLSNRQPLPGYATVNNVLGDVTVMDAGYGACAGSDATYGDVAVTDAVG